MTSSVLSEKEYNLCRCTWGNFDKYIYECYLNEHVYVKSVMSDVTDCEDKDDELSTLNKGLLKYLIDSIGNNQDKCCTVLVHFKYKSESLHRSFVFTFRTTDIYVSSEEYFNYIKDELNRFLFDDLKVCSESDMYNLGFEYK